MKSPARLSVGLAVGAALTVTLGLLYLSRVTEPSAAQRLQDGLDLSRNLDGRMGLVRSIRVAKSDLAAGVIAGRLTLLEAAAEFQALDMQNPDFHWRMFRALPGDSDGERYCRMVMRYAENLLLHQPSEAEAVLSRLEEELQTHLRQHGTVCLPSL
jgi:hypothetical protein